MDGRTQTDPAPPGADAAAGRTAPLPPRVVQNEEVDPGAAAKLLDALMALQRPVVVAQILALRRRNPDATPSELVALIERQYLNTVTATGGAAGAAAIMPGIGTVASVAVTGVETAGFLEMTTLFGQAVAEIHGLAVSDPVRARALVQSLLLGSEVQQLVRQFGARAVGGGASQQAFWGELITSSLPAAAMGELSQRIQRQFLRRFAARQGVGTIGRLLPFGVGAAVGGAGNRLLGRRVVRNAREAFGPAPLGFPLDLHPEPEVRQEGRPALEGRPRRPFLFFKLPHGRARRAIESADDGAQRPE
ncbi:MAG: hypothetical protein Q4E05_12015 [Pseudoclavibacter sp.]|nr:hypothetical protein [Pseudoclavibacter sp.]